MWVPVESNPHLSPKFELGCVGLDGARFDEPAWKGKPRCRLVCRNERTDGWRRAWGWRSVVGRMIAYANAARRVKEQAAQEG
jgi:hypothetical protein